MYISKIQNGIKEDPKSLWKFVNIKRKNTGFPQVLKYGNRSSTNGQDTAKIFAKYFKSVQRNDYANDINYPIGTHADVMVLSAAEVRQGLEAIDPGQQVRTSYERSF